MRERLRECVHRHGAPGPGDVAVELAPVPVLDETDAPQAPVVRLAPARPAVLGNPEAWPLETGCAHRIVLAHPGAYTDRPAAVVAEAGRVLAPEGMIFVLEGNRLHLREQGGVRVSPLPEGLHRRQYRALLEAAGLEVLEQWSLSLLPPGLSATWQKRLAGVDAWTRRGLPPLASVILTVGYKRVEHPLPPVRRFRFAPPAPGARGGLVSSRSIRY